jgi:hypothetical protein
VGRLRACHHTRSLRQQAIIAVIMNLLSWRKIETLFRDYCQIVLLDTLLAILHSMQVSPRRHEVLRRRQWAQQVEWCARRVRKDLLPPSFLKEVSAGEWLKHKSAGWVEAFHHMQREIMTPVPGGQKKGLNRPYNTRSAAWPQAILARWPGGNHRHRRRAAPRSGAGRSPSRERYS